VPAKQTGKKHGKGTVKSSNGFVSVAYDSHRKTASSGMADRPLRPSGGFSAIVRLDEQAHNATINAAFCSDYIGVFNDQEVYTTCQPTKNISPAHWLMITTVSVRERFSSSWARRLMRTPLP
jgi:hypothetical protein